MQNTFIDNGGKNGNVIFNVLYLKVSKFKR